MPWWSSLITCVGCLGCCCVAPDWVTLISGIVYGLRTVVVAPTSTRLPGHQEGSEIVIGLWALIMGLAFLLTKDMDALIGIGTLSFSIMVLCTSKAGSSRHGFFEESIKLGLVLLLLLFGAAYSLSALSEAYSRNECHKLDVGIHREQCLQGLKSEKFLAISKKIPMILNAEEYMRQAAEKSRKSYDMKFKEELEKEWFTKETGVKDQGALGNDENEDYAKGWFTFFGDVGPHLWYIWKAIWKFSDANAFRTWYYLPMQGTGYFLAGLCLAVLLVGGATGYIHTANIAYLSLGLRASGDSLSLKQGGSVVPQSSLFIESVAGRWTLLVFGGSQLGLVLISGVVLETVACFFSGWSGSGVMLVLGLVIGVEIGVAVVKWSSTILYHSVAATNLGNGMHLTRGRHVTFGTPAIWKGFMAVFVILSLLRVCIIGGASGTSGIGLAWFAPLFVLLLSMREGISVFGPNLGVLLLAVGWSPIGLLFSFWFILLTTITGKFSADFAALFTGADTLTLTAN